MVSTKFYHKIQVGNGLTKKLIHVSIYGLTYMYDDIFTLVQEVSFLLVPYTLYIKFDLVVTLGQNPTYRLFLQWKKARVTLIFKTHQMQILFSIQETNSKLSFGLK